MVGIVASLFVVSGWFVRTVLTNARKIELLENEIAARDERRNEDRETWLEMKREFKQEIKDLREDMHRLIK